MARNFRNVLVAGPFCLAICSLAAAEPVVVTDGSVLITGHFEPGSVDVTGTRGFSLRGIVDEAEAGSPMGQCGIGPPCFPHDSLSLFLGLGGYAIPNAVVTLDGITYPLSPSEGPNAVLVLQGSIVLPDLSDASIMIEAPFTVTLGEFSGPLIDPVRLQGAGTATLWLSPAEPIEGVPPGWFLDQIRYDFDGAEPVPEPGTVLLVGTGAMALWRSRIRRRRRL